VYPLDVIKTNIQVNGFVSTGAAGGASPVPVAVAMSIGHNVGLALEGGDVVKDLPTGPVRCATPLFS
jgi:hypothetical protein